MSDNRSQVDALRSELEETSRRASELWSKHSPEQLLRRPAEKKWSAAECIEHLNITNRAYALRIEQALRELDTKKLLASAPMATNFNVKLLKWWLEPPSRLKLPTGAGFLPVAVTSAEDVLHAFQELNAKMDEQLSRGRCLPLDRAMIASPFSESMKYNVYSAFVLIAAHNRRHLWQAANALETRP